MQAVAIFYGTQLNIVLYSSQPKKREKIVYLQCAFDEFMCFEWEIVCVWVEMNWAEEFESYRLMIHLKWNLKGILMKFY